MKIRILGAHNIESRDNRCISFLIDDILAIDAGSLTAGLSLAAQQKLQAVLLTHQHYDHVRDIPALGINFYLHQNTLDIHATQLVLEILLSNLLNDVLYPNYTEKPPEKPSLRFNTITPGQTTIIAGYAVLPLQANHAVPAVGYQIMSSDGKKLFYTSDTGPGLADVWRQVTPDLLIIEVTGMNKLREFAIESGHLTPALLQQELASFREIQDYLPQIVLVHMNPIDEKQIQAEIHDVEKSLKTKILFGHEGMQIEL